ncbi:protein tesmin/TSO1-like CXC 5 isoform X2 [Solanum dulcamara]|uniref:protein tesmin/TSO1-like CXC 5 isoform X2 n=1 Tax=Solanum dulcamara TaxID=45834 RepID=UPI0024865808|nr:protein tesmin/TSO1-like CXC 5 isoform X2 [Solanum dulcamara]
MDKSEGGHLPPTKAQSEPASAQVEADYPAKKLARQLDFTGGGGSAPGQAPTASLSEHAKQIQPQTQPQLQQHILLMPMQQTPVLPPHPSIRPLKPESPKARSRQSSSEAKDGTPKKPKQCNCKHSRCLKLYCECFASGIHCDGCNCANCLNNVSSEGARREAVEATLERNPNAFRPKIASSPHGAREKREEAGNGLVLPKHNKGCHCKKSGCLKKYCECFQANILCSENCKCMDCKNFEGSEERQALFHGDHANNMAYLQQAANAAITDAIGSSGYGSPPVNKKGKPQELFVGSKNKDPVHRLGQFQQENQIKASVPPSLLTAIPGPRISNAALGPSKLTYRSLLADLIQMHDIKELCSVLIVYTREAAKMLADEKDASLKQAKCYREASYPYSGVEKVMPDDCSTGIQAESMRVDESRLDSADVSKEGSISPGTLALMCDEQDTIFTAAAALPNDSTSLIYNTSFQLPHGHGMAEIYPELERIVLAQTRDCLKKLITLGEIKEKKCSSMVRDTDSGRQNNASSNGVAMNDSNNQEEPFSNGVASTVPPPPPHQKVDPGTTAANNACPKVHPPDGNRDMKEKNLK